MFIFVGIFVKKIIKLIQTKIKKLDKNCKKISKKIDKVINLISNKLSKISKILAKILNPLKSITSCILSGIVKVLKAIQTTVTVAVCVIALLIAVDKILNKSTNQKGQSVITTATNKHVIHELFPNATWNDLAPCGVFINEQEEYNKALQCVNTKVWPKNPVMETNIPRCFVVKASAVDVHSLDRLGFNFVPIMGGAVVGVYQPETRTVYLIENIDIKQIYRHELQHYFMNIHVKGSDGGGHFQKIWSECEPPYYDASKEVILRRNLLHPPKMKIKNKEPIKITIIGPKKSN